MVGHDELMQKADQGGMRAGARPAHGAMVAPVLRRLRNRNPGLRVFVPVGRATLGAQEEAGRLLALLQRDGDVAQGMVFEFAQQDLGAARCGGDREPGRLARAGATLALREVYLGGLDLAALRQLGVRFLSFPPHAVDAGSGPSAAWSDFARQARALQMQVVVGDVKTPQQATAVSRYARFGHGPFFAPPRKVRPDAGVAARRRAQRQRRLISARDDAAFFRGLSACGSATSGAWCTMAWRRFPSPSTTLKRHRERGGTVILVTNSPRSNLGVETQLREIGVDPASHDRIVTSGDVTQVLMRLHGGEGVYHVGCGARPFDLRGHRRHARRPRRGARRCCAPGCSTTSTTGSRITSRCSTT